MAVGDGAVGFGIGTGVNPASVVAVGSGDTGVAVGSRDTVAVGEVAVGSGVGTRVGSRVQAASAKANNTINRKSGPHQLRIPRKRLSKVKQAISI